MCASCHTARRHARTTTAQQKEDGLSSSRRSHKPEELGLYPEVSRAPLKGFFFYWSVAWLDFSFRKIMAAGWRMIWGHVDIDREGSKDIAKKKLMDSTKKKTKNQTLPSRKLLEDFKNSMIWLMFEDSLAPGLNIYWQWEGTSSCDHRDKGLPRLWPGR